MRVAYICADAGVPVFGTKGCSVHVQEIVGQLLQSNHQVTLFAVRKGGENVFSNERLEFREYPLAPSSNAQSRELQQRIAAESIAGHLDADRFDLIYERYSLWSSASLRRAQRKGIPSILEVNAPLIEEQIEHRQLFDLENAAAIRSQAFEAATSIVAVSEGVAEYVKKYLPPKFQAKVHVVTNGVDTNRFRPDIPPIAFSTDFTIGFLGTVKPWHGLESLLSAFQLLLSQRSDVRLRIIGDGPMRETLQKMVVTEYPATQSKIEWVGEVQPRDVPRHLTSLDVAVAPYLDSPNFYFSPLKVFEYMSSGRAVVASAIGQLPSIIEHGSNGMLYPPGDSDRLAMVLLGLVEDPPLVKRLGNAARETAVRYHSWSKTLETILSHVHVDVSMDSLGETNDLMSTSIPG